MKNQGKITKVLLNVNEHYNVVILAIVSSDPDYKLTLKLNRTLGLMLRASEQVVVPENGVSSQTFSRFADNTAGPDLVISLISNRSGKYFLLRKLGNVDYLFVVNDQGNTYDTVGLPALLRQVESVTAVFMLEGKALKDKNLRYLF